MGVDLTCSRSEPNFITPRVHPGSFVCGAELRVCARAEGCDRAEVDSCAQVGFVNTKPNEKAIKAEIRRMLSKPDDTN